MDGLSILALVREALAEIRANSRALLKTLLLPALVIFGLESIKTYSPEELFGLLGVYGFLMWRFLFWALSLPFYVLFAIVCHRTVILGASSLPNAYGLFWSDRETRFFGWTMKFMAIAWGLGLLGALLVAPMPDQILGMNIAWYAYPVFGIPGMYMFSRIYLVFPATAVGQDTSLKDAWQLSAENGFRLLFAVLLPIPVLLAPAILSAYLFGDDYPAIDGVISSVVSFLIATISTCIVSVAYKKLSGFEGVNETT